MYLKFLDAEARKAVHQAKKEAAKAASKRKKDRARNLEVARAALQATEAKFRQPRKRDGAYLSWLRQAPCLVCWIDDIPVGITEAAHVRRAYPEPGWRPVGASEKPHDFRCLPLCRAHHRDQHDHDNHDWYAERGIYPPTVCAQLKAAHVAGADPVATIELIADEANRKNSGRRVNT